MKFNGYYMINLCNLKILRKDVTYSTYFSNTKKM